MNTRQAPSLDSFKRRILNIDGNPSKTFYLYGDGNGAINLSRIRMGLSGLNAQRKKYRFIQDGSCPTCGFRSETPLHYFLVCQSYAAQREQLIQDLADIVQPLTLHNFSVNTKEANNLLHVILYGSGDEINIKCIYRAIHRYIIDTKRFL